MAVSSALLCLTAAQAVAENRFSCRFDVEGGETEILLNRDKTGWRMEMEEGRNASFHAVTQTSSDMLHLLSTDQDPDAGAVSLLSIAPDGSAFLSLHGSFPTPAAELFTGQCEARD